MSLEGDIQLLSLVPLFGDLTVDQRRLLAFSATRRDLSPGEILVRKGEPAASGFVVASGAVELSTGEGAARVVAETCRRGTLIGELPLFIATTRRTTATAAVAATVVEITRGVMQRMLEEYPHVALTLRAQLARRLETTLGDLQKVRQTLLSIGENRG